jgi:hypothetical protein
LLDWAGLGIGDIGGRLSNGRNEDEARMALQGPAPRVLEPEELPIVRHRDQGFGIGGFPSRQRFIQRNAAGGRRHEVIRRLFSQRVVEHAFGRERGQGPNVSKVRILRHHPVITTAGRCAVEHPGDGQPSVSYPTFKCMKLGLAQVRKREFDLDSLGDVPTVIVVGFKMLAGRIEFFDRLQDARLASAVAAHEGRVQAELNRYVFEGSKVPNPGAREPQATRARRLALPSKPCQPSERAGKPASSCDPPNPDRAYAARHDKRFQPWVIDSVVQRLCTVPGTRSFRTSALSQKRAATSASPKLRVSSICSDKKQTDHIDPTAHLRAVLAAIGRFRQP